MQVRQIHTKYNAHRIRVPGHICLKKKKKNVVTLTTTTTHNSILTTVIWLRLEKDCDFAYRLITTKKIK